MESMWPKLHSPFRLSIPFQSKSVLYHVMPASLPISKVEDMKGFSCPRLTCAQTP